MSSKVLILLFCTAITAVSYGQAVPATTPPAARTTASAPASDTRDRVAEGMVIVAELSKSVDAKKAKAGDSIEARTTMDLLAHGKVLIPRTAKIIGHITEVKAPSKESGASVGIAFDRVSIKGEREVVLQAIVQAIGRPLPNPALADIGSPNQPDTIPPASSSSQSDDIMRGMPLPPRGSDSYPGQATRSSPDVGSRPPATTAALGPKSQGVVGFKGVSLKIDGATSLISAEKGNVHLDGGTQLVLRAQ